VAAVAVAGCGEGQPGAIAVSGTVVDGQRFLFARLGRLAELTGEGSTGPCYTEPCDGSAAVVLAAVVGASVSVDERPETPAAISGAAGEFALGPVPAGERLHLAVSAPAACDSRDGLGLQFPESDVAGYPVGLLPTDGFLAALAADARAPAADLGLVVFLLMDAAPFPDSAILDDAVTVELSRGGGRVVYGGWDGPARRFVLAGAPRGFHAPAFFTGLVAVVRPEDGTQIAITDRAPPAGRRPAYFLRYTARPQTGRCVFYFLRALG